MDTGFVIFATVFTILLVLAIYGRIRAMNMIHKNFGFNYLIDFNDLKQLPDLANNPKLRGKVRVYSTTDEHLAVQSKLNDTQLKAIIMQEYGLADTQVDVRPAQLAGGIGIW